MAIQVNKIKNTKHKETPAHPQPIKLLNRTKHLLSVQKSPVASDYLLESTQNIFTTVRVLLDTAPLEAISAQPIFKAYC